MIELMDAGVVKVSQVLEIVLVKGELAFAVGQQLARKTRGISFVSAFEKGSVPL